MRLYLSGVRPNEHEHLSVVEGVRVALSYPNCEPGSEGFEGFLAAMAASGAPMILLSGARDSQKSGSHPSIADYVEFIVKYGRYFEWYSNLSVAGSPAESARNLDAMHAEGLMPVPEFRIGDPPEALEDMPSGPVILGGIDQHAGSKKAVRRWVADCFRRLGEDAKVHGSGVSDPKAMVMFPWESVDSDSWRSGRRWGKVLHKDHRKFVAATKKKVRESPILASKVLGRSPYKPGGGIDTVAADVQSVDAMIQWVDELNRRRA